VTSIVPGVPRGDRLARATSIIARARRVLGKGGPKAVADTAADWLRVGTWCDQEHHWYELVVGEQTSQPPLEPLRLVRAADDQIDLVEALGQSALSAREDAADGHEVWLVLDGERPVFACRIFRRQTPVRAAQGGWLRLPEDVVCLEHSVTAADQRGRGTAPRAWSTLADELADQQVRAMITKVTTENMSSRKAVLKAGFRDVGIMRFHRRGPLTRTRMRPIAGAPMGEELRRRLESG